MSYLLLGDIHASDRPPSSCTDSYLDDLLDLLRQTVRIARERDVSAVVLAGDVFHSKAPSRNSHRLVQLLIRILADYERPVYVVPGNHDMQHDRLESVGETQPLGVLMRSGLLRLLVGWAFQEPGTLNNLYGVPWLQKWTDEAVSEALRLWREREHLEPALVVTHAPLYPPGLELEWEHYPAPKWAEAMGGAGACYYGHVHERHGIWYTEPASSFLGPDSPRVVFCNPGAISRGSIHEHNLTRVPACAIWHSDTGQFEEIPLDAKPPEQVFRLAEHQEVTDVHGRLDQFLAGIGSATLEVMSVESVLDHIRSLGLDDSDTSLAEELIREASGG